MTRLIRLIKYIKRNSSLLKNLDLFLMFVSAILLSMHGLVMNFLVIYIAIAKSRLEILFFLIGLLLQVVGLITIMLVEQGMKTVKRTQKLYLSSTAQIAKKISQLHRLAQKTSNPVKKAYLYNIRKTAWAVMQEKIKNEKE